MPLPRVRSCPTPSSRWAPWGGGECGVGIYQGNLLTKANASQGIARKHSASPAQVVIRWALQHGMMALLGPIEPHQPVAEALAAHRLALDEDDLDAINALDGAQLPRTSPWGLS
jgi:diketogulonate reductase-like aldo/keto reductase